MIDTLFANSNNLVKPPVFDKLSLKEKEYIMLTMHRPANVDEAEKLKALMSEIVNNVHGLPIIFPIHPRTAKIFTDLGIVADNLFIVEPMGYLEFNYMVKYSKAVITDSGGITEETTVMGVPCITLRDNTERPETCTIGTNELIGTNPKAIKPTLDKLFSGNWKKGAIPHLWDGKTADRIITQILNL
jgi:UDP-N-acetylglucosamine 2-epimerase (non-hydrolysing)